MDFKIPYISGETTNPKHMQLHIERKWQYPYSREAVKQGFFRTWIAAMDEDTLDRFIVQNERQMTESLQNKTMGPNWAWIRELLYRNALYMTEKHLRHNEDTTKLDEDLHLYYGEWEGKYQRAIDEFTKLDEGTPEETSGINPYY